jgi:hypothetical protein
MGVWTEQSVLKRSMGEKQSVESTASMRRGRSPGSKQGLDVRGFERSAAIFLPPGRIPGVKHGIQPGGIGSSMKLFFY